MSLIGAMRISSSGMTAERFRMDVISSNIANANSISANGKEAYRERGVSLIGDETGVRVGGIVVSDKPLEEKFEPGNPNADKDGKVFYSNVKPIEQMVNMIGASRSYEANIAAFNTARNMVRSALQIGRA